MKTGVSRSVCGAFLIGLGLAALPLDLPAQEQAARRGLRFGKSSSKPAAEKAKTERSQNRLKLWFLSSRRPQTEPAPAPAPPPFPDPPRHEVTRTTTHYPTQGRPQPSDDSPSSVSFLPDGTVITRDTAIVTTLDVAVLTPPADAASTLAVTTLYPPSSSSVSAPAPELPPEEKPKPVIDAQWAQLVSPGLVKSPYPPHALLDVQGFRSGSLAEDPASKKIFRVP